MGLVDRYLHAVRFWLPRREQDDILAELSANLREQMDDRAAELGRPLTEDEEAAILKQHGRPVMVASQYGRGAKQLISPAVYPVYRWMLKLALVTATAVYAMVATILTLTGQGTVMDEIMRLPSILLMVAACQTIVFAAIDRVAVGSRFVDRWDPRSLPKIPQRAINAAGRLVSRWHYLSEMLCGAIFGAWWLAALRSPHLVFGPGAAVITFGPVWHRMFIPILLFILAEVATAAVNFAVPDWSQVRPISRIATRILGVLIAVALLRAGSLIVPASAAAPPEAARVMNMIFVMSAVLSAVILVYQLIREVHAILKGSGVPRVARA